MSNRRTRGTGTVWEEKDRGRWVGTLSLGRDPRTGKLRRRKVTAKTRAGVVERLEELRARRDAGDVLANSPTVGALYTRWLEREIRPHRTAATATMWENLARVHLLPVFGDRRVDSVTVAEIEDWLEARSDLAASTLRKLRSLLALTIDVALRLEVLSVNRARAAKLPATRPPKERRALDVDEARRLVAAAEELETDPLSGAEVPRFRLGAFVRVAIQTGARPSELTGLKWADVDAHAGEVRIRGTKTAAADRVVALTDDTAAALKRLREVRDRELGALFVDDGGLIFVTNAGTRLDRSNLARLLRRIAAAADVEPVSPYVLRHTAATLRIHNGGTLEAIGAQLGHRDPRTTAGYVHAPKVVPVETLDLG